MRANSFINWLALFSLSIATLYQVYWIWGLLFIFWAIQGIWNPVALMITPVLKIENPILFWFINILWLTSGIYTLLYDLLWRFKIYDIFGIQLYQNVG